MSLMKKLHLILSSFLIFFLFIFSPVKGNTIFSGFPVIIDGDTVKINNYKIRLFGIDAPEKKQFCNKPYINLIILSFNKSYPCGEVSTNKLKEYLKDELVSCKIESKDFI